MHTPILYWIRRKVLGALSIIEDCWFDFRFGIHTSGIIGPEELDVQSYQNQGFGYQGTRVRHFRKVIKTVPYPLGSVFVDMGSGKGRVLIMASQYGFKGVVGIEFSHDLCEIARRNIARVQQKKKITLPIGIVESDGAQYKIQKDENVFYFFRPFDETIMESVLENLTRSYRQNPRAIWLIFNNFVYHELFSRQTLFVLHHEFIYGGAKYVVFHPETKSTHSKKGG